MVGCYGRAEDGQTIRLDLDNELEGTPFSYRRRSRAHSSDAQWFSRTDLARLIKTPGGTGYSDQEVKQLEKNATSHSHEQSEAETANALAPSERKEGEENKGDGKGLTRVPPETAIAGMLIRQWAEGTVELVSKL